MSRAESTGRFRITRRQFLAAGLGTVAAAGAWGLLQPTRVRTFIARAPDYLDLSWRIRAGLAELGIGAASVRGKRILLKPNLVETGPGIHRTTHPAVVQAAAEVLRELGAAHIIVGEGPAHITDTPRGLQLTGMADVLRADRLPFVDLNYDDVFARKNRIAFSGLPELLLPASLREVDWVVSLPKLKTHHWVGMSASMKNLFGLMPGSCYGWPKNVLHWAGIDRVVLDINLTVPCQLAIVDGIVGMEGDGPIMGSPVPAGVLVMGSSLPAVDATCARIMGIRPERVGYLGASGEIGAPIAADAIQQVGEPISAVRRDFALLPERIPAHRGLRA
ncbi:MAG: DUF362 domain-containing protein [Deltaproteobacteria bacterium]|nr:DUF362 domain-containing protein [Deltaproteobacteria bacterium]